MNALPQAFPLAVSAAIYPPVLVVLLLLLAGERPRRLVVAFYAGALILTASVGLIALAIVKSVGLTTQHSAPASGATYVALGFGLLATAGWAWRHTRRPVVAAESAQPATGRVAAWSQRAQESEKWAFVLGLALFLPSPFYLMAVKTVADSGASPSSNALAVLICSLGVLVLVESVLIAVLIRPDSVGTFQRLDAWLRRNGWMLTVWLALAAGVYALAKGVDLLT